MSTELATIHENKGLLALLDQVPDIAGDLQDELGVQIGSYLKFSGKSGLYTFNGQIVEHGTVLAFNMRETEKGVICFVDSNVAGRVSHNVFSGKALPTADEQADIHNGPFREGEGWRKSMSFQVKFLDDGQQATLNFSSNGGVRAATNLFKDWATKARMNIDDTGEPLVPLVEIGAEEKKLTQAVGSYFVPTLKIIEWVSVEDLLAETKAAPAPAPKPAPKAAPARAGGLGSGVRGRRA